MKKVILFLSIIGVAFLMTSCLGEVSNNYRESAFVYIAHESIIPYGRTHTGRYITSNKIQLMIPGTMQVITYNWDEEYGRTALSDNIYADNVVIEGDPVEMEIQNLRYDPLPVEDEPAKFSQMYTPIFAQDEVYFGDNWLIQYEFESKKGEEAHVEFYIREEPDENVDVTIDIRLVITGEAETGASATRKADFVAFNMSGVRHVEKANPNEIKINFYYYLKGQNEPKRLEQTYKLAVSNS